MNRACISACLSLVFVASSGWALEGKLAADKKEAIGSGTFSFTGSGAWKVKDVIAAFNGFDSVKNHVRIGLDQKLALKTVTDFKTSNISVMGAMEQLAKNIGAKVFAINETFIYIANDLPPGFPGANPTPKAEKPEPAPPKPVGPQPQKPAPSQQPVQPPVPPPAAGTLGLTALPVTFPACIPGCSNVIPWSHVGYEDCKKDPRPKVVFIYDDDTRIETNNTAHFFEALILEDPECIAALKGFYFVKVGASEKAALWPENLLDAAKMPEGTKTTPKSNKPVDKNAPPVTNPATSNCMKGAALYLLKPDCTPSPIAWCERNKDLSARALIEVAKTLNEPAKPKPPATVADKGNAKDPVKDKPVADKPPDKPKKKGPDDE